LLSDNKKLFLCTHNLNPGAFDQMSFERLGRVFSSVDSNCTEWNKGLFNFAEALEKISVSAGERRGGRANIVFSCPVLTKVADSSEKAFKKEDDLGQPRPKKTGDQDGWN
jgi:hypothetical protein